MSIAQNLAKLLQRRGYEVQIAAALAGSREIIKKERPLFISSDLDLPDGTGLELLDMVRSTVAASKRKINRHGRGVIPGFFLPLADKRGSWHVLISPQCVISIRTGRVVCTGN